MKNKKSIPKVPEPVKVLEKIHQDVLDWTEHLREISPRIEVLLPTEELLAELEKEVKFSFEISDDLTEINIQNWPKHEDIAFIVRYDESMPGEEKKFLLRNTSLFCYGRTAFALDYYQSQGFQSEAYVYSLADWDPELLDWEFREKLIVGQLIELQKKVPPLISVKDY